MLTKTEQTAIANVIARLKKPDCGCSHMNAIEYSAEYQALKLPHVKVEIVSRLYIDTWVITALELLLDGGRANAELAARLSRV